MVKRDTEFWEAIDRDSLELPFCAACGHHFFYPRPFCPRCWSRDIERREVSGRGRVWSYAVARFPVGGHAGWKERLPYVVALVELDEGVRIMSNIVGCPPEEVVVGLAVEVTFHELDGRILHAFRPSATAPLQEPGEKTDR